MIILMVIEFCCVRNLQKRYDRYEGHKVEPVEHTEEKMVDENKMWEDALKGIILALEENPEFMETAMQMELEEKEDRTNAERTMEPMNWRLTYEDDIDPKAGGGFYNPMNDADRDLRLGKGKLGRGRNKVDWMNNRINAENKTLEPDSAEEDFDTAIQNADLFEQERKWRAKGEESSELSDGAFRDQIRREDEAFQKAVDDEFDQDQIEPFEETPRESLAKNNVTMIDGKEVPPTDEGRTFNENDILGEVRDLDGEIVIERNERGMNVDWMGRKVNDKGYLINEDGDVIDVKASLVLFARSALDPEGEIPSPHWEERYNFNPHDVTGDFDIGKNNQPVLNYDPKG